MPAAALAVGAVRGGRRSSYDPAINPKADAVPQHLGIGDVRAPPSRGHMEPLAGARLRHHEPPHHRNSNDILSPEGQAEA
jgi:hypothetical protein